MLHPIVESLFLLKVARGHITESIMDSDVEGKTDLINYIQNEASDYEVMHLVTIGEMPEVKFDSVSEAAVWEIFREHIIMNTDLLKENVLQEDIMTIVNEMGPVSMYGYSSAAPILEFSMASGQFDREVIEERMIDDENKKFQPGYFNGVGRGNKKPKSKPTAKSYAAPGDGDAPKGSFMGTRGRETPGGTPGVKIDTTVPKKTLVDKMKDNKGAVGAGTAALGIAGIYGLYKIIKKWRAKVKAANGSAEVKAAKAGLAAAQTKLKAAKSKA